MLRFLCAALVAVFAWSGWLAAQKSPSPPIPADRAADSFRIYSRLIPLGETAGPDWPHGLWLIRDETLEMASPGEHCQSNESAMTNPRSSVHPPGDRQQDFAEILQDYDRHCHDRFDLRSGAWDLKGTVRLLTPGEQTKFEQSRWQRDSEAAREFAGAPALYGFSAVYFNARHTVALVYATHWCGGLCGQGFWIALELKNGEWKQAGWRSDSWIS